TPDAGQRAQRALAAAEVLYEAGSFSDVESLLHALDTRQLEELQAARAERLQAQVALALRGSEKEATMRLVAAGDQLRVFDPSLARATHLEALHRAYFLQNREILEAVARALAASEDADPGGFEELRGRGWAQPLEHGFPAGTDLLREATLALRDKPRLDESELPLLLYTEGVTRSSWDFDNWETITRRTVRLARDSGALTMIPQVLGSWAD